MAYFRCGGGVPSSVKNLPTYKTASGSTATFNTDMTENLNSCIAEIVAQQASGTPTPSSPLPISGFSAVNVWRGGINLFDKDNANIVTGYIGNTQFNTNNNNAKSIYIPIKPNTQYTVSKNAGQRFVIATSPVIPTNSATFTSSVTGYTDSSLTITSGANDKYLWAWIFLNGTDTGTIDDMVNSVQIEFGNQATTYEPYNGTTFTVSFGQTVYGGYIDCVTGNLVITYSFKTFDGSESWNKHGTIPSWFYVDNAITDGYMNNAENDFQICNCGLQTKYADVLSLQNGHFVYGSANKRFIFKNTDYTEVTDFQNWLSNNNMQVAYKLATPIEIQCDSITIPTLSGTNNNIFADTGDIDEVKYILSVGEYLSQN